MDVGAEVEVYRGALHGARTRCVSVLSLSFFLSYTISFFLWWC